MPPAPETQSRHSRLITRLQAWHLGWTGMQTAFLGQPEPRIIGLPARGQQLVDGQFLLAGELITRPGASIWQVAATSAAAADAAQSCAWLDDLAALGDLSAQKTAHAWVQEWVNRFGRGRGPGWTPALTGARLIRWISHGSWLTDSLPEPDAAAFLQSLARQTIFLARRWHGAPAGPARITALAGLVHAGVSLKGMAPHLPDALRALAKETASCINADGAIPARNPEQLLSLFSHLIWCRDILADSGHQAPQAITDAITRIAPTLRHLRHADGNLARFHGGGKGLPGRLDAALFQAAVAPAPQSGLAMGYARLAGGRCTLIADAAAPPQGASSAEGHASSLAIELTSGRRPVIVSCGSGARLGADWRRAGRATPSHSTLGLGGVSSSHLGAAGKGRELLRETPKLVQAQISADTRGHKLEMSHDGYRQSHGLTHARILTLDRDGRALWGEDMLAALTPKDQALFDRALTATAGSGVTFDIRFHLHPDVTAELAESGSAVTLFLKSGEIWQLDVAGDVALRLMPSVYLDMGDLKPRPTQQVVLSGGAIAYGTRVRWSLAKAKDTPIAVRDLAEADAADTRGTQTKAH